MALEAEAILGIGGFLEERVGVFFAVEVNLWGSFFCVDGVNCLAGALSRSGYLRAEF